MVGTVYRQCTLCEAHCGIKVEVEGERVVRIGGDPDDVMSRGYICPKAGAGPTARMRAAQSSICSRMRSRSP